MIDIHAHILPNIDDGATDIESSMQMLLNAKKAGVNTVVVTPHFIVGKYTKEREEVAILLERIKEEVKTRNIDINLLQGNEIMLDPETLEYLEENKLSTLNGSKYVLIEFSTYLKPINIEIILDNFISDGFIPVIAHPERYEYVKRDYKVAEKWTKIGAILQMNINSINGSYGKEAQKTVIKLLKNNLISLWGSDVHDFRDTYSSLDTCIAKVEKVLKHEKTFKDIIYNNPQRVIENKDIPRIERKIGFFH